MEKVGKKYEPKDWKINKHRKLGLNILYITFVSVL